MVYIYLGFSKTNQFGARDLIVPILKSFINHSPFTSRLKLILNTSGYDANLYRGHTFHRSGATFLNSCGGTALMVMASGDWSCQCITRYLYLSVAERLRSQFLIAQGINATSQ